MSELSDFVKNNNEDIYNAFKFHFFKFSEFNKEYIDACVNFEQHMIGLGISESKRDALQKMADHLSTSYGMSITEAQEIIIDIIK